MLLLAIWLIASGLLAFVHISFAEMHQILAGLAISAGVCIVLGR